jgi:hypothetical protein
MANSMETLQSESSPFLPGSISAPVQANRHSGNWGKRFAAVAIVVVIVAYAGVTVLGQSNAETGALTASSLKGGVDL